MENINKVELKARKKAYKKAKKKAVRPWSILTGISAPLMVIFIIASIVVSLFDNTIVAMLGGSFWELVNGEERAIYYAMDYARPEDMYKAGDELCYQVEAEGATLLMNNGALPLKRGSNVSTLSSSSVNLVYGGTGSGNVDASKADDLKTALEKSGLNVNPTLWDFYKTGAGSKYNRNASAGESAVLAGQSTIAEVPVSVYTPEVKESFEAYGDAVIVTLSRIGGEGYDLEHTKFNYLALSQEEKDMLDWAATMKANGTIKSIIVLINTSNALQVDFLKDNPYTIDAVLWIGGVGATGTNAVADILVGKVNPSGCLVDTYCYDNFSSPAMQNFKPTIYGGDTSLIPDSADTYMIYQEGIYVGYKYYETRYEDYVLGAGNAGDYHYGDLVGFPFGYGLSYTTFDYGNYNYDYHAETDQFVINVQVTNTGKVAGKKTVQVYAQTPYTEHDMQYGVEKASVQLCAFTKTEELQPNETTTVSIKIDRRDLACYDTYGYGTFIYEPGDYYFAIADNAHEAINNILAKKGYSPEKTDGRMDAAGDNSHVIKVTEAELDTTTYAVSLNGTPIKNQLSSADINQYPGVNEKITYLSRNDWEGTWPKEILQLNLTEQLIRDLQDLLYDPANYTEVPMPTMGANNGLKLYDMIGRDYDDERWDLLLDQLTFDEMVAMIGDSFHWRMPAESVAAPGARDENGPQGLTASLFGGGLGDVHPTAFTSEDVMAATWNTELIYEVGRMIGNNCLEAKVVALYGPGANIHRTPYSGRNFEYYSEDGFLSGEMCGAEVQGIQDKGVDVVLKHFALNDCEQDRLGQAAWVGEQAAREIYLKAFQKALEECDGNGVMTAYTRWGAIWSGGHKGLMTGILRGEWGNNGMSITDNVLVQYCNGVDGVLAGGVTTFDAMLWYVNAQLPKYENDPVVVSAMREACHHNLYALANSSAMNGMGPNTTVKAITPPIITTCRVLAVVFGVLFVAFLGLWIWRRLVFKKSEAYITYHAPIVPAAETVEEQITETETQSEE